MSKNLQSYDGLNLDIKAYLVTDVNTFAMANGTICIFADQSTALTSQRARWPHENAVSLTK